MELVIVRLPCTLQVQGTTRNLVFLIGTAYFAYFTVGKCRPWTVGENISVYKKLNMNLYLLRECSEALASCVNEEQCLLV